jgi:hypothetical protein
LFADHEQTAEIFMVSRSPRFKRWSTARDRAEASTALEGLDSVEIGIEPPQHPETNLPGVVSAAKGPAKSKSGHSGVRVMDGVPPMDERETRYSPIEKVLLHTASASKRHLASQ